VSVVCHSAILAVTSPVSALWMKKSHRGWQDLVSLCMLTPSAVRSQCTKQSCCCMGERYGLRITDISESLHCL